MNPSDCFVDHTMYECNAYDDDKNMLIVLYLNSTPAYLYPDIFGRSYGGGGAPTGFMVYEVEKLPVLNPNNIDPKTIVGLRIVFNKFTARLLGSVFDELGASTPEEVSLDKVKPDRRELDKIIMGDILGLTEDEQLEVYRAIIDLVKSRIEKAKSVEKKKKAKEGIDIDLLVRNFVKQLGEYNLGQFYKEKILLMPGYEKSLPEINGRIKIEKDLFKWRLADANASMDCSSEIEAKYLKNFIGIGLDSVKIPEDEKYLKKILPELESLRAKVDKLIKEEILSIINPKAQKEILHRLWQEIMRKEEDDEE